jgi:hypothetical protein
MIDNETSDGNSMVQDSQAHAQEDEGELDGVEHGQGREEGGQAMGNGQWAGAGCFPRRIENAFYNTFFSFRHAFEYFFSVLSSYHALGNYS